MMQTHVRKLLAGKRWPLRSSLPTTSVLPVAEAMEYVTVHLIELSVGIARPKVVPPAAEHGRQFHNDLFHILPALLLAGALQPVGLFPSFTRAFGTPPSRSDLSSQ